MDLLKYIVIYIAIIEGIQANNFCISYENPCQDAFLVFDNALKKVGDAALKRGNECGYHYTYKWAAYD